MLPTQVTKGSIGFSVAQSFSHFRFLRSLWIFPCIFRVINNSQDKMISCEFLWIYWTPFRFQYIEVQLHCRRREYCIVDGSFLHWVSVCGLALNYCSDKVPIPSLEQKVLSKFYNWKGIQFHFSSLNWKQRVWERQHIRVFWLEYPSQNRRRIFTYYTLCFICVYLNIYTYMDMYLCIKFIYIYAWVSVYLTNWLSMCT